MKLTNLCFMLIAASALSGCNDEVLQQYVAPKSEDGNDFVNQIVTYPSSKDFKVPMSRAGSSFETDWENCDYVYLMDGEKIMLPWTKDKDGSPGYVSPHLAEDIKKEDGWIMLAHTLNSDPSSHEFSRARYVLFYNEPRGSLKVFYFQAQPILDHSSAIWAMSFNKPQSWVNGLNEITLPTSFTFANTNEYIWETTVDASPLYQVITSGWNAFEAPLLTYDPIAKENINIILNTRAYSTSFSSIDGTSICKTEGEFVTEGSTNPFTGVVDAIVNYTGDAYKSVLKDAFGESFSDSPIGGIMTSLHKSNVKAGLSSLISVFDEKTYTFTKVNLASNTTYKLNCTTMSQVQTGAIPYNIPIPERLTGVKLGSWNLEDNPTIYINPVGVLDGILGPDVDEHRYRFKPSGKYDVKLIINPQLEKHVKSYSVTCMPVQVSKPYTTLKEVTDYGKIASSFYTGSTTGNENAKKLFSDTVRTVYSCDNLKISATYAGLCSKYGKPSTPTGAYQYVYAPDIDYNIRGTRFTVDTTNKYVKVTVKMVVEYEGKESVVETTRTYLPKFEWDPDIVKTYSGHDIDWIQSRAAYDMNNTWNN